MTANGKDWHRIDGEVSPGGSDSEGQPKRDKITERDKEKVLHQGPGEPFDLFFCQRYKRSVSEVAVKAALL